MFHTIFLFCIAFGVALLPVYLWGYGVSALMHDRWNRSRFFLGILIGSFAVSLTYLYAMSTTHGIGGEMLTFGGVLLGSVIAILLLIYTGSPYARVFLQKIAIVNSLVFLCVFLCIFLLIALVPGFQILFPMFGAVLLTPLLEEAMKHLGSVGLTSHEFRFSLRDILSFSFFVVLGFVFAENLLYLWQGGQPLSTWILRSVFTILAHIFTTLLLSYFLWRALSFPFASVRYLLTIFIGFLLAGGLHIGYNFFLGHGSLFGLVLYGIVGYVIYIFSYKASIGAPSEKVS